MPNLHLAGWRTHCPSQCLLDMTCIQSCKHKVIVIVPQLFERERRQIGRERVKATVLEERGFGTWYTWLTVCGQTHCHMCHQAMVGMGIIGQNQRAFTSICLASRCQQLTHVLHMSGGIAGFVAAWDHLHIPHWASTGQIFHTSTERHLCQVLCLLWTGQVLRTDRVRWAVSLQWDPWKLWMRTTNQNWVICQPIADLHNIYTAKASKIKKHHDSYCWSHAWTIMDWIWTDKVV